MKISRSSKIQSLILAAALSIGLGFVSPVFAQERSYILECNDKGLTDLGTLGGGSSRANGINDAGQVIGYSQTAAGVSNAFITGPNGWLPGPAAALFSSSWSAIDLLLGLMGRHVAPATRLLKQKLIQSYWKDKRPL